VGRNRVDRARPDGEVVRSVQRALAGALLVAAAAASPAAAEPELWQSNSRGDDIHVFDVRTRELLRRIEVGPEPHGLAAPQDGRVVYVTLEANERPRGELLWVDPGSYRVRHRMEICREPHAIATTPDGHFIYVPCRDEHYWVVDATAREVVARIHTGGRPHNTRISRDGRWGFLSPMGDPARVTVVDVAAGHAVAGEIPFAGSVRPPALSHDGRRLFQHVDGLNGFQVADVARRRVVATVAHRTPLGWFRLHPLVGWVGWEGLQRCHGLAIRPDQAEIWSVCGSGVTVHDLTDPGYAELAHLDLEAKGYWITFSPDSRWAFVALSDMGRVAVVDAEARRIVAHLDAGHGPKRNLVIERAPARPGPE